MHQKISFKKNFFCEFNGLGSFLGTCPASDRDDRKPPSVVAAVAYSAAAVSIARGWQKSI